MADNSTAGASGTTLLTILFVALKLLDTIDWSWWWVLSPVWISAIIALLIGVVMVVFSD